MDARAGSLWHKRAGGAIPRTTPRLILVDHSDLDPLEPGHSHLDTRDGTEVVLGDRGALLGPPLAGETLAPVSAASSLLLCHLD